MTTFDDLFPGGRRADVDAAVLQDDHHTARRLSEMIGDPRDDLDATRPRSNVQELVKRVNAAAHDAVPGVPAPLKPARRGKRRRRIDVLSVSAASIAVFAVVAAVVVGGVQAATASPAASALQSLRSDEATILNSYQSLVTGSERLGTAIEQGRADAAALRATLQTTGTAPDPTASETEPAELPIVDEAALAAALAAVDAYMGEVDAVVAPELPTAYERGEVNEDSLADVGAAIDAAQAQLSEIDAAASELRRVRTQVDELRPPLQQALAAYAATFPAHAESVLDGNPDAESALHDAVTTAAAGIVSSRAFGAEGTAALTTYRNAVIALIDGQLRADRERESEEEERRENEPQPPPPTEPLPAEPQPTPQPTEPPTTDPESPPVDVPPLGGGIP